MKFTFCPHCGDKLSEREIGDEGLVKWCDRCNSPMFEIPQPCVLTVAVSGENEMLLIKQDYVSKVNYVGIAGYIQCGETAESAAIREVTEEVGIVPKEIKFIQSSWFEKKGLLMLGFYARVERSKVVLSDEVDAYKWFSFEEAVKAVRPDSSIQRLILEIQREIEKKK